MMSEPEDDVYDGPPGDGPPPPPKKSKVVDIAGKVGVFKRGDHVELAQHTLRSLVMVGDPAVIHADGAFYRYRPDIGQWESLSSSKMSLAVQAFAGSPVGPEEKARALKVSNGDTHGALALAAHRAHEPDFFAARSGVLFKDCFVRVTDLGDIRVMNHSSDNRARFRYDFNYVEKAAPRRMLDFLHSIYRDDADKDDRIRCDQEFFGACLLGLAPMFQRCMVKVNANGNNGKGTLAKVIDAMMPPGSVAAVPPHLWSNEYYSAKLAGKLINMVGELPATKIEATNDFKGIIAGDRTSGRNPRGEPFDYLPLAGHFFSANDLPGSADLSEAFWRRMIVFRMTRSFREGDPDRDPKMAEKVIADRPAIVSWLVDGAARLVRQGHYTLPASHHTALGDWQRSADTVREWMHERCDLAADRAEWTQAALLHQKYKSWCDAEGYKNPVARRSFSLRLSQIGADSEHRKGGTFWGVKSKGDGW